MDCTLLALVVHHFLYVLYAVPQVQYTYSYFWYACTVLPVCTTHFCILVLLVSCNYSTSVSPVSTIADYSPINHVHYSY